MMIKKRNNRRYAAALLLAAGGFIAAVGGCANREAQKPAGAAPPPAAASSGTAGDAAASKPAPAATPAAKKDLPDFKKDEDYRAGVRQKLIADGWSPARSADEGAENCAGQSALCAEFPELEAGPSAGIAAAIYRWKKGDRILLVQTVGSPPLYAGHSFEKKESVAAAAGNYLYSYRHESGEDSFLWVLRPDKTARFTSVREGGDGMDLKGIWNYDAPTGTVTVTLDGENGAGLYYEFKLKGASLVMTAEPDPGPNVRGFKGTVYKRTNRGSL